MDIFSYFEESNKGGNKIPWITNGPAHWPTVNAPPFLYAVPANRGERLVNSMTFIPRIVEAFKPLGDECRIGMTGIDALTEGGLFHIPFIVVDRDAYVAVFVYSNEDQAAAGKFAGAKAILASLGFTAAAYYSPSLLPDADPTPDLETSFHPTWIKRATEAPKGSYAMWHKTSVEREFSQSECFKSIRQIYEMSDGAFGYVAAAVLEQFGFVCCGANRMELPDELDVVTVTGPMEVVIKISFCAEKGLRFHFHEDTAVIYRNTFLRFFADYCEGMRFSLLQKGEPLDDPSAPLEWWEKTEKFVTVGPGSSPEQVGALFQSSE